MDYNSFIDYITHIVGVCKTTQLGYESYNSDLPSQWDSYVLENRKGVVPSFMYVKEYYRCSYNNKFVKCYTIKFARWNNTVYRELVDIKDIEDLVGIIDELDDMFMNRVLLQLQLDKSKCIPDHYIVKKVELIRDYKIGKLLKEGEDSWR